MAQVSAVNALGQNGEYHFGSSCLSDFNGAKVWVAFDPFTEPMTAVVELAEKRDGFREGKIIDGAAPCLSMRRKIARGCDGWGIAWEDGLTEGVAARKALPRRVAESVRAIDNGVSKPVLTLTETRDWTHPADRVETFLENAQARDVAARARREELLGLNLTEKMEALSLATA